ncbi:hypothetical protein PUMCH_002208 [Australozyma saopauloensis]|uniref:GST N-terminal domain-containing protein n=1 Tax=Australozyma saopauloensis TaxID=291208 RepID=A0AAX4H9G2_9ASCO|nr:hypothetical protein PUMCH_002208 [[Candida] saopauloensis]
MSQGTLYANSRIRAVIPTALVKHFNLDVKIVDPASSAEYTKFFPLGKVPAFVGPKGVKLTEVIAISVYCMFIFVAIALLYAAIALIPCHVVFWSKMMRNLFKLYSYPCLNKLCRDSLL